MNEAQQTNDDDDDDDGGGALDGDGKRGDRNRVTNMID